MRPKYDVNELFGRPCVTSDDILKKIRRPDENFMKFHEKIMGLSKMCQKVIRSDPGTL